MITVREIVPSASLRGFVRSYHYTEMDLGATSMSKPMTARPEQMMQFALRRRFTVVNRASGTVAEAPDVVVVGRQTRRNLDLVAVDGLSTLTVHFEPTGFYRLFHIPMRHLTDLTPDATDVLGPEIRIVHERVVECRDVTAMIGHTESFLGARLDARRPLHPVQSAAAAALDRRDAGDVRALAADTELSTRQLERAFHDQVGVGPKLFSRIARFADAMQAKSDQPGRRWADVAAGAGYFDQTHFIRDCHTFGSDAPSRLMETWIDCRP